MRLNTVTSTHLYNDASHPGRTDARERSFEAVSPRRDRTEPPRIAVIGTGIAGAACAARLLGAGFDVSAYDKAPDVGGRMAARQAEWTDSSGVAQRVVFDHGAPHFSAESPRFRAVLGRAEALGYVARWEQSVYADFPAASRRTVVVGTPDMTRLCRHLLNGVPLQLGHAVRRLQRGAAGWELALEGLAAEGPFDRVVLALPPAQSAMLMAGHQDDQAHALDAVGMTPCWTLMAVTDDFDWPWDAAAPEQGPLAWVVRQDRAPGRRAPPGIAQWVAHATPAWSADHLDDDPAAVADELCAALRQLVPSGRPAWHHVSAYRWQHAYPEHETPSGIECGWNEALGIGVCGDFFGGGSVEAAWCSGDAVAAAVEDSLTCDVTGAILEADTNPPPAAPRRTDAMASTG